MPNPSQRGGRRPGTFLQPSLQLYYQQYLRGERGKWANPVLGPRRDPAPAPCPAPTSCWVLLGLPGGAAFGLPCPCFHLHHLFLQLPSCATPMSGSVLMGAETPGALEDADPSPRDFVCVPLCTFCTVPLESCTPFPLLLLHQCEPYKSVSRLCA